jgi:hypothetical protein
MAYRDDCRCCDGCGEVNHSDAFNRSSDFCESCLESGDYVYCHDIEAYRYIDDCYYDEENDEYTAEARDTGPVYSYNTDVLSVLAQVAFVKTKRKLLSQWSADTRTYSHLDAPVMGVELEVDSRGQSRGDIADELICNTNFGDYGICKGDSTVTGPELVTLPADLQSHRELYHWDRWCEVLRPIARGHFASSAGLHIHINKRAFSPLDRGKFVAFMNDEKNAPFLSMIAQRDIHNSYCSPTAAHKNIGAMGKAAYTDKFRPAHITGATVEVRIFRSSLLHERILKNLEFCDALLHFVKVTSARGLHADNFTAYVQENKTAYPELLSFISNRIEA